MVEDDIQTISDLCDYLSVKISNEQNSTRLSYETIVHKYLRLINNENKDVISGKQIIINIHI